MVQTFTARSFLLSEHSVYERLARHLLDENIPAQQKRWSIVCERKEDLLAVRTQIFSLLSRIHTEKHPSEPLRAWSGVSLYTPDTLVRNFCLTLSNNSPAALGHEAHTLFRRPFIDVVEQEKIMRLLLLRLGYSLSDVAPLAKQILTLADTPLPADESFLSLLLEVQNTSHSPKSILDIPDSSLRTICVAYQLAQKIFASFCRLQSFVGNYWISAFIAQLRGRLEGQTLFNRFLVPEKFLGQPLLWIGAPEYCRNQNSYRPGNFQASFVDALRDGLFTARDVWCEHSSAQQICWWARTQIDSAEIKSVSATAHIESYGSYAALSHHFSGLIKNSDAHSQFLLGDMDKRTLNTVHADGSGVHSLTPPDFEANQEITPSDAIWNSPAAEKVEKLRTEFQSYWEKLASFDTIITDALARYDLSPTLRQQGISFELMLHRFFDSETFTFGQADVIAQLPPALSLLPGLNPIQSFVVLGPPHSQTAPSFHLRLLNSLFHLLRSRHVNIEPIASEESYRGYWQSILTRSARVTFMIRSLKELNDFPDSLRRWCLPPVQVQTFSDSMLSQSPFERWLGGGTGFHLHDDQWPRLLKESARKPRQVSLGVTEFENYVECPLQFYWVHLHAMGQEAQPAIQPDPLLTGHRTHAMAEKLIRGFRQLYLLEDSQRTESGENLWLNLFSTLDERLLSSEKFLANSAEEWVTAFSTALSDAGLTQLQQNHARTLIHEIADVIFSMRDTDGERQLNELKKRLVRETIRRALRKLIQSELYDVQTNAGLQQQLSMPQATGVRAAFLEHSVQFEVHPQLLLTGRIDRVDTHSQGDRIIDYKTSKVAKKDPPLVLDPRLLKTTNKLSVQGAVYSLAWAQKISADSDSNSIEEQRGVAAFSLLRLKTMDMSREPYSHFTFESPLKYRDETYTSLANEYERRAQALVNGDFSPRPLTASICTWCILQSVCPAQGRTDGDLP